MHKITWIILSLLLSFQIVSAPCTTAETYPSKPINLWVAWGAGSATDISQRAIANIASKALKQPIIISNVTGAGGTLALGRLKSERADGYTLVNTSSATMSRIPHLQPV
ncbi:MAG: tripartite tricarboxylate transporter substrate-binding protein, partial [Syntrophales bacterium]|nr:tripartite tricarboxylate transporter substrate-binding protein [Syntrophales bacterium]